MFIYILVRRINYFEFQNFHGINRVSRPQLSSFLSFSFFSLFSLIAERASSGSTAIESSLSSAVTSFSSSSSLFVSHITNLFSVKPNELSSLVSPDAPLPTGSKFLAVYFFLLVVYFFSWRFINGSFPLPTKHLTAVGCWCQSTCLQSRLCQLVLYGSIVSLLNSILLKPILDLVVGLTSTAEIWHCLEQGFQIGIGIAYRKIW